jgi:hypothetical protein
MGVATVSYVVTQSGCAPDTDASDEQQSTAPYDDEEGAPEVSEQALRTSVATDTLSFPTKIIVLPPVGNLMPPPVGNLMAPPVIKDPIVISPVLPPVGNLMPPLPVLERK